MKDNESPPKKSRKKLKHIIRHDEKSTETIGCYKFRRKSLHALMVTVPPREKICRESWRAAC